MNARERGKLIDALHKVVQIYDSGIEPPADREQGWTMFENGICWAVSMAGYRRAYTDVRETLTRMGVMKKGDTVVYPYPATRRGWSKRATICCMMIEFLRDEAGRD